MPAYNNAKVIAQRIIDCNKGLDSVFTGLQLTQYFAAQLKEIKKFYADSFNNSKDEDSGLCIAEQYQNFIVALSEVKNGSLTVEEALDTAEETIEDRRIDIILKNILTVCELLFWVAAAAVSYAACITVGVPLLVAQPILGIAIMAGTALGFCISLGAAGECFEEFATSDQFDEEHQRETDVFSFFRPASPRKGEAATSARDIQPGNYNSLEVF